MDSPKKWKDLSDDEIRKILAAGDFHQGDGCDEEFIEGWEESGAKEEGQTLMDYMIKNDGLDKMNRQELLQTAGASEDDDIGGIWSDYIGMNELKEG